jgi:hypothetical protein
MVVSGLSEMYETRQTAMAATNAMDAQGVRRPGSTFDKKGGSTACLLMP